MDDTALAKRFQHKRLTQLGVDFPVMIAPMVGLSHVAFRHLIRHYTPVGLDPLLFTEMLSTRRLPFENINQVDELRIIPDETHFIPQLLGNEESYIMRSIQKLLALNPWGFDINMGCPARQHLRHNWGVRLLGDADYAARIVAMTKRHSPCPVSVKMRCAQEKSDPGFLDDFTAGLEASGADWLTIHARPQTQGHKGTADWQLVQALVPKRGIPVVLNGDIQTADDALHLLLESPADGVMIGRAATARPWIIWQIAEALGYPHAPAAFAGQKAPKGHEEEGRAYLQSMLLYCDFLEQYFDSEDKQLRRLRFHVINGHKWLVFGHAYYSRCMKAKSLAEIKTMTQVSLDSFEFPMTNRISLL
ncbi:MAG: tRNA-dihydrouridine synthase family protein [Proteobacteria bacterium]|nr:tRNA-dihydrouridine synthase family protein [Pseudomonadota bacterium]